MPKIVWGTYWRVTATLEGKRKIREQYDFHSLIQRDAYIERRKKQGYKIDIEDRQAIKQEE